MSEKQLHESTRATEVAEAGFAVRSCEMEAGVTGMPPV